MKKLILKQSTSFLLRIIFFLFLFAAPCTSYKSFSQSTERYIVRMEVRLSANGNDLRIAHYTCFLSGNYLLEPVNNLQVKSYANMDEHGKITPAPESTTTYRDSIVKYIFSDFNLKQSTEFNLSDTPEVITTYPLVQKKPGISFRMLSDFELFPQLGKEIPNFYFITDTTINGFRYKILEDTSIRVNMNNFNIKRVKIYVNQDLPNFAIHPMSANLDNKFNGVCSRIVLYDTANNTYIFEWLINKETDSKIHALLNECIAICKHLKEDTR